VYERGVLLAENSVRLFRPATRTAKRCPDRCRDFALGRKKLIESCEHCNEEDAEIPLDNILDRVTGSDPSVTAYILEQPAKCPRCFHQITEKTLVEPE
jgi:hypothetical protein